MKYSLGSRISVNNVNCTVLVTDPMGNPLTVKTDRSDKILTIRPTDVCKPIIQK